MYLILWEYQLKPARRTEFEKIYAPDGDWAKLFRNGKGYLGTELIQSDMLSDRYVTIDRWNSKSEYEIFLSRYEIAYKSLDVQCEGLTEHESPLGTWKSVGADVQLKDLTTKEAEMIVRMWHGRVPTTKADAYREFTNRTAIPDYQSVKGNLSVHILERREGEITHFITLTFWDNFESIKGFAGEDVEVAKYYPEDKDFLLEFEPKDFLLEFEPRVVHYEVVGQS